MSTYDDICEQVEKLDGTNPVSGVTFTLPNAAIAAYADNLSLEVSEIDDWIGDAEEAYMGEFDSDRDFAQNLADNLDIDLAGQSWPLNCIDWELAARDLMVDYFESHDYYFRAV